MNRKYVIYYLLKRGGRGIPKAAIFEADNAKDARNKFDSWYYSRKISDFMILPPHPFHITVKRYDTVEQCPFCGAPATKENETIYCLNWICNYMAVVPKA